MTGIGAAVAMIANPVAGALSDRTVGRFGGAARGSPAARWPGRPALVRCPASMRWSALFSPVPGAGQPDAMQASLSAAVPDQVPVAQRGTVSGWIGLPQSVGVLLAVVLVTDVVTGNGG